MSVNFQNNHLKLCLHIQTDVKSYNLARCITVHNYQWSPKCLLLWKITMPTNDTF